MTSQLADAVLRTAIARRSPTGTLVVHSDRGGQFRSRRFQRTLRAHGLIGSMGRVASAGGNAAMESFFALLQNNVFGRQRWTSRDELRLAIITWIERTYHRRRRQRALGKLTPIEFETVIGYKYRNQAARPAQPSSTKPWADPSISAMRWLSSTASGSVRASR